jgi:hypothetical protein
MAPNNLYDTLEAVAIVLPSVGRATTFASNVPPAGASVASTLAAVGMATIPAANTFSGPVPVGVPIVVSSSPIGGTALEFGGRRKELHLAKQSVYAARHLQKAEAFQGPTIEVQEHKSNDKFRVSSRTL